eukprot:6484512-Amphidinium_carterae.1
MKRYRFQKQRPLRACEHNRHGHTQSRSYTSVLTLVLEGFVRVFVSGIEHAGHAVHMRGDVYHNARGLLWTSSDPDGRHGSALQVGFMSNVAHCSWSLGAGSVKENGYVQSKLFAKRNSRAIVGLLLWLERVRERETQRVASGGRTC